MKFKWTCRQWNDGDAPAIAGGEVQAASIMEAAHEACECLGIDSTGHWDITQWRGKIYPEATLGGVDVVIEVMPRTGH